MVLSPSTAQRLGQRSRSSKNQVGPAAGPSSASDSKFLVTSASSSSKVCPFYSTGNCRFGSRCRDVHQPVVRSTRNWGGLEGDSPSQRRPILKSLATCKYFLEGRCMKAANCPFSHPSNATTPSSSMPALDEPCKYFQQGSCLRGEACHYKHVHPLVVGTTPSAAFGPCKFFLQGRCREGDKCPFLHPDVVVPATGEARLEQPLLVNRV
jgi:hypothetical protein